GEDYLGAEDAHQPAALDRETVRHRNDEWIALLRADHGEADARVAARRLHHRLSRLQCPVALGGLDDVERQPVLDRGGRIEGLGLYVDANAFRRDVVDADAGRVSNSVQHAIEETAPSVGGSDLRTCHLILRGWADSGQRSI